MAQVQYSGVPDTAAPSQPPNDYLQPEGVQTPVGAFGQRTAQGLQALGEGTQQAGQFFGQVAADHAYNSYQDSVNKILHGDPTQMVAGPDGSQIPDEGYLGLKGEAAMRARPDVVKQMEDLRKSTLGTLPTPAMQLQFDTNARRFQAVSTSEVGTHADTETNVWASGVNTAKAKLGLDTISANPDSPQVLLDSREQVRQAYVKNAQLKFGNSPEIIQHALQEADKDSVKAQVLAVGAKPDGASAAMRIVENNRDTLGGEYSVLADHYRTRVETEGAVGTGINLFSELNGTTALSAGPSNPNNIGNVRPKGGGDNSGFVQVESFDEGVKLTVDNAKAYPAAYNNGQPMSIDQIAQHWTKNDKSTWATNVAAGSGLPVNQPLDLNNPQIAAQFARGVHTAEWGGAKNAVPVKPVADYLPGASGQIAVGDGGTGSNAPPDLKQPETPTEKLARITEEGTRRIEQMDVSPKQREQMLSAFRSQVATHELSINLQEKVKKDNNESAMDEYVKGMAPGQPVDPGIVAKITSDPRLLPQTREHLIEVAKRHSANDVDEATQAYGSGFWDTYKKVIAPAGDPNRIADPTTLLAQAGPSGNLTLAGVRKLQETMQASQKSVDTHSVEQAKAGLIAYAKSKLSFEQETGPIKIRDPKGEMIFNSQFIPKFMSSFDNWMSKQGKDPYEFLTRDNVDKMLTGMRDPKEMARARMFATGEAPTPQPREAAPQAPQGMSSNSWGALMARPPQNQLGQEMPLHRWAAALGYLRAHDDAETKAAFNKQYGATGWTADDVLERLKKTQTQEEQDKALSIVGGVNPVGVQ